MRRGPAWIVALLVAAGPAQARPVTSGAPRDEPPTADFWRDVIEPHGAAVTAIVARARRLLARAGEPASEPAGDDTAADGRRLRTIGEALRMLRHAHQLAPEHAEVLGLVGYAADELGRTDEALDALETCVRLHGPERAGPEVTSRLGQIYLRLDRLDDAVRWLRHAQGPIGSGDHAGAAVYLATALAARGEMASAIDVLGNALPARTSYFTDPVTLVSFALAVHYDRDEQAGAAFEVLDRLQAALQQELGPFTERALATLRFAPAEDAYYYHALLYEALGAYAEARAEWMLYAGLTDAPWRRRALEHVRAIDAQRRAAPAPHSHLPILKPPVP